MKVFLSAVTSQFKECRDALASDFRANEMLVKVQEDFRQSGGGTLLEKLEGYIGECDLVIALVGNAFGSQPTPTERGPLPVLSYAQWEYAFARGRRLDGTPSAEKTLFVYIASDRFLSHHPVEQSLEEARLQQEFAQEIFASGRDRSHFDTPAELRASALRDALLPAPPRERRRSRTMVGLASIALLAAAAATQTSALKALISRGQRAAMGADPKESAWSRQLLGGSFKVFPDDAHASGIWRVHFSRDGTSCTFTSPAGRLVKGAFSLEEDSLTLEVLQHPEESSPFFVPESEGGKGRMSGGLAAGPDNEVLWSVGGRVLRLREE